MLVKLKFLLIKMYLIKIITHFKRKIKIYFQYFYIISVHDKGCFFFVKVK